MSPRSLAHLKSEFSEAKWTDAQNSPSKKQNRGSSQQETGHEVLPAEGGALPHRPVSPMDDEKDGHQTLVVPVQDPDPRTPLQELPAWKASRRPSGPPPWRRQRSTRGPGQTHTRDRGAACDERCSQTVLDFLATADVGKTAGPPAAEVEEAGSKALMWENGEREHLAQMGKVGKGEVVFVFFSFLSQGG